MIDPFECTSDYAGRGTGSIAPLGGGWYRPPMTRSLLLTQRFGCKELPSHSTVQAEHHGRLVSVVRLSGVSIPEPCAPG